METLSVDNFSSTNGGKNAEFTNLSSTSGPCRVITTQIKSNITQKFKKLSRCNSLVVSRTKYSSPKNVGLISSRVYGTRVEDSQISLNTTDVFQIQGIFESSTTGTPTLPSLTISGSNSDLILGELAIGKNSGAVAVVAEKLNSSAFYIINKGNNSFILNEQIDFSESKYSSTLISQSAGDRDVTSEFALDDGQREHFYDISRITRKTSSREPFGALKIIFDRFVFDSNDNGDLIAANSYPSILSKKLIPSFNGSKNTDLIDARPRVSDYSTSSSLSPFDFSSRVFTSQSNNPLQLLSVNENFVFDYDFYLPRTDKLTLSKDKKFSLVLGTPSEVPVEPSISKEVLDIATIKGGAYVYDINEDVEISLSDHRRYTMSDLRDIESRVSNLEYYTSLSLLEKSTESLLITDDYGYNRFKCGFFVDEFNDNKFSDINNLNYDASIYNKTLGATQNNERIDLSIFYSDDYTPLSSVNLANTTCTNLKITGNKLSLDYSEVVASKQPFASKVVNVNPFNIITWSGVLDVSPSKDTWTVAIDERRQVWGHGRTRVLTSSQGSQFIRSRNINFSAARLKPNTRFKLLFDKRDLSSNTLASSSFPKLIEISNNVGSFKIGETVNCFDNSGSVVGSFRICSPNHKTGPIDSPSTKFTQNPYNPSVGISSDYGPQSTFLNIDTESLSRNDISGFWGKITTGNTLIGSTSKANATVSDVRLITDSEGVLLGSVWVNQEDKFAVGKSLVELSLNTPSQKVSGEVADSNASTTFTSSGNEIVTTTITYSDPLAQTFLVEDENGIIPTSVDIYFYSKDSTIPVSLEIREVSFGTPGGSDKVISGLRKVLPASSVNTSADSLTKTTFKFDSLVRLVPGEYAVVLLSDSNEYQVWVSEIGSEDISTANSSAVNKVFINKQPHLGTLFKSQNASTWVPSPLEDLKFTLNKAQFVTTGGTAKFYNSNVRVRSVENKLPNNPIKTIATSGSPNSGQYILVTHPNHGMHSGTDLVEISGVQSDVRPQILSNNYLSTDNGSITVDDGSIFINFEQSGVELTNNPGYIKIGNEIIKYEGISGNILSSITRGALGTIPSNHSAGDFVYKYEFNGVSLSKINTQFTVDSSQEITLDSYYVQISGEVYFVETKSGGGSDVYASKNKQFSQLKLNNDFIEKINDTQITASIRSISSTSVDGLETSYVDEGFEPISIDKDNYFYSPRMVASSVNESQLNSTSFAGNKSFTLELNLNTSDQNVSPIIDLTQAYVDTSIYRINRPISLDSYPTDNRVNSNNYDPHSFIHISNRVNLEESAKSLNVLFSAFRDSSSDIRVLYKIFTNDSPDSDQIWNLFPGYDNLDVNRKIINLKNNSGRSDSNVRSSLNDEYLEYSYTIDNLPTFTGFQIKIVGTSENQAYSPLIKELRAIATK